MLQKLLQQQIIITWIQTRNFAKNISNIISRKTGTEIMCWSIQQLFNHSSTLHSSACLIQSYHHRWRESFRLLKNKSSLVNMEFISWQTNSSREMQLFNYSRIYTAVEMFTQGIDSFLMSVLENEYSPEQSIHINLK